MYASLPMLAMDQQDVMTTKLPNDVLNGIGHYVADINVKDVFTLSMANRKLRSIFTTDVLAKLVTFARLIKAIPYDTKDSRISQATASSLQIKKDIKEVRNRDSRYLGTARITIESPLNYSIYTGQHALTKFLFEAGVPYDSQSLLVAIAAYNKPTLKLLLDRGAKPDELHHQICGCKKQTCHCSERITFTPHDLALSTRIERFYEAIQVQ